MRWARRTRGSAPSQEDTSPAADWLSDEDFDSDEEQLDVESPKPVSDRNAIALTARQRIEIYRERKALEAIINDALADELQLELG